MTYLVTVYKRQMTVTAKMLCGHIENFILHTNQKAAEAFAKQCHKRKCICCERPTDTPRRKG